VNEKVGSPVAQVLADAGSRILLIDADLRRGHLHEQFGFSPELRRAKSGQEIVLKRCPFEELATTYPAVICSLHLGLMRGALVQLGAGVESDSLEPFAEPGACIAHVTGV